MPIVSNSAKALAKIGKKLEELSLYKAKITAFKSQRIALKAPKPFLKK